MPIVTMTAEADQKIEELKQFTGGGGMLPEGVYQFGLGMPEVNPAASADKHPWMRVEAQVVNVLALEDGSKPSQSLNGRKTSEIFSFSPKTVATMRALLVAAGVRYHIRDYAGGVQGLEFDTDYLAGKMIEAKVIHQDDNRPDAKYPKQSRWVDLQPVGTYAAGGGVVQHAQPGAVPGVAAAPFVPGGYAQQPAPVQAQQAPQGYVQQPAPQQGYVQQAPQGYVAPGQQPPPPNGYGR